MKKSNKIIADMIVMLFALIMAVGGWIYLFIYDWKLALCLTAILWSHNIAQKYKDKY